MSFDCLKTDKIIQLALSRVEKVRGNLEPENVSWVSGDKSIADEGTDLCYRCAKRKARELINEHGSFFEVNTASSPIESDTCVHCSDCGELLSYNLTESGVEEELDHYLDVDTKIDLTSDEEAYHLQAILDGYNDYEKHKIRILRVAWYILDQNFWYKIKNPNKYQYCRTYGKKTGKICGKNQYLWCCETFLGYMGFNKKKLPEDEGAYFNRTYVCMWHKGVLFREGLIK